MQPLPQLQSADNLVNEPVFEKELRGLETRGQGLLRRVLDHPGTREPDQRARFGDDHIAQRGKTRGDAAHRGMGQHGNERQPRLREPAERRTRVRHLHQ